MKRKLRMFIHYFPDHNAVGKLLILLHSVYIFLFVIIK